MGALLVPSARRRPPLAMVRLRPDPICTVTPGWMVRVTPLLIVTLPQTTMGLLLAYQVVFTAMVPLSQFVGGGALVVGGPTCRPAMRVKSVLLLLLSFRPSTAK